MDDDTKKAVRSLKWKKLCRNITQWPYDSQPGSFNCYENIGNLYSCKHCPFKTDLLLVLKHHVKYSHILKRHQYRSVKCPNANINITKYSCQRCFFETYSLLFWFKHVELGHRYKIRKIILNGRKWYECCQCLLKSRDQYQVKVHINQNHSCQDNYKCSKCYFATQSRKRLQNHIKNLHTFRKLLNCHQCTYKSTELRLLQQHVLNVHPQKTQSAPRKYVVKIKPFKCNFCMYTSPREKDVRLHMEGAHPTFTKWFECQECSFKSKRNSDLIMHKRIQHNALQKCFKCDHCPFQSTIESNLMLHVWNAHSKIRDKAATRERRQLFKCRYCEFETCLQANLHHHVATQHVIPKSC